MDRLERDGGDSAEVTVSTPESTVEPSMKSRILQKIREDMARGDEPAMLSFDSGGGHSRYASG